MTRKLASVQKIAALTPIEEKDKIELATVLGWTVIVKKGDFQVGDLCVYVEADSVLPEKPEFEFLRARCYSPKWHGFVIRNMRMAGVYSQGIVFPVSIIPIDAKFKRIEGQDVTDVMGIRKYDPEALIEEAQKVRDPWRDFLYRIPFIKKLLTQKTSGSFPSFLHKTDETRIQAVPSILDDYRNTVVYVTEKLDGQSFTCYYRKGKFGVCGRNMHYPKPTNNNYWEVVKTYDLKRKLTAYCKKVGKNLAIQGEICGPGIQGNKYGLKSKELFLFNVFDIDRDDYMPVYDINLVASELGLRQVPYLGLTSIGSGWNVPYLLEISKGVSFLKDDVPREGIVIRETTNANRFIRGLGQTLSFKVINPDFDIKYNSKGE